jgi:AcrR family transcriptional regulator
MARPKSEDKRNAIMSAATRVIVTQGLGAPTAVIAREAGVANGSLFTYFETKAELFNQLYLALKTAMATAAMAGLPPRAALRKQVQHVWSNWTRWAVAHPEQRRALALLGVSDELTPASRAAGHQVMAGIAGLMERSRANGPLHDAPLAFAAALMNSMAEATMDFMLNDPANAEAHSKTGFDALWRALT